MPRLISRLLKCLEDTPLDQKSKHVAVQSVRRERKRSLRGPLPPTPSFSPFNRTHSILLDDVNPIINSAQYTRHKSLPPSVLIGKPRPPTEVLSEYDKPRYMTDEERSWWASPYCA